MGENAVTNINSQLQRTNQAVAGSKVSSSGISSGPGGHAIIDEYKNNEQDLQHLQRQLSNIQQSQVIDNLIIRNEVENSQNDMIKTDRSLLSKQSKADEINSMYTSKIDENVISS